MIDSLSIMALVPSIVAQAIGAKDTLLPRTSLDELGVEDVEGITWQGVRLDVWVQSLSAVALSKNCLGPDMGRFYAERTIRVTLCPSDSEGFIEVSLEKDVWEKLKIVIDTTFRVQAVMSRYIDYENPQNPDEEE